MFVGLYEEKGGHQMKPVLIVQEGQLIFGRLNQTTAGYALL